MPRVPPSLKIIRGTNRPCRRVTPVAQELAGTPTPPKWLSPAARTVWRDKVTMFDARGVHVRGCEGALAQLCALEVEVIRRWRSGDVSAALLAQYRRLCADFFCTPASNLVVKPSTPTPANAFK